MLRSDYSAAYLLSYPNDMVATCATAIGNSAPTLASSQREDDEKEDRQEEENPAAGATQTKETSAILLVEDNEIIRRVIAEELTGRRGYGVEAFPEAEPALERAREVPFDLVVMDISLPGMNGIEALQELRSTEGYARRPVVAITAFATADDRDRFLSEGFSEFLPKPFSAKELAGVIHSLLT